MPSASRRFAGRNVVFRASWNAPDRRQAVWNLPPNRTRASRNTLRFFRAPFGTSRGKCTVLFGALLGAVLSLTSQSPPAQTYPDRPVKFIVGFPPGGNVDLVGRLVAQWLAAGLGQQVIVENKVGAGTMIANDFVAKAAPDGYTLLLISGAHVTLAATQRKLPYDSIRSFAFISSIVTYPTVISVRADSKYKTLADLVADARANPGKLNFPSPGIGTFYHLTGELLNSQAGIEMVHVPYRGGFEPVGDLLAGRVDLLLDAATSSWPNIQAGKIRPLAVAAAQPVSVMPNVPLASQTVPGFESVSFSGLAAPIGTPEPIIERLNREVRRAVDGSEAKARFNNAGGNAIAMSPDEFRSLVETEIDKWKKVVELRKIQVQ
jgi:tripartite-type tricarboxylate transporter receptor subunit TctC